VNATLKQDSFEGNVGEAFEIFILLHSLADHSETAKKQLDRKLFSPEQWKAYEFFKSHSGRIEIQVRNNLQRVYFPIRPVCHFISKDSKKQLMQSVDREFPAAKISGLLNKSADLIDEMVHNEGLSRSTIQITPHRLRMLKDFSTVLAFLINFIMLAFYEKVNHARDTSIPYEVEYSINVLGIIQVYCFQLFYRV